MNYTNPATGQKKSWIYTNTLNNGDPSQFLLNYQYYDTLSCTVDSTGENFAQDQIGIIIQSIQNRTCLFTYLPVINFFIRTI
jgi:hypothetical protein